MRANAEAAKRRLAQINEELQLRKKTAQAAAPRPKTRRESFGEAAARIARESKVTF